MSRIASITKSNTSSPPPTMLHSNGLDDLPLPAEIAGSVKAFLNNLSNPVHKAPFSPERLMNMFQDFYAGMEGLVQDSLPDDLGQANTGELLSADEIVEQKLWRTKAEAKRLLWREEIEERVCVDMYDKIFELRTSTDELRDEALMSKVIAMNLIGVSLEQLGVGLSEIEWRDMQPTVTLIGEELQSLNNAISPKKKIDILVACHKQIVAEVQHTQIVDDLADALDGTDKQPSGEAVKVSEQESEDRKHLGADAILPILIYSIIKSNPAKLVSHIQYITRFRTSNLLSGEEGYCLTNLEAAVGFLETFDDSTTHDSDPLRVHLGVNNLKSSNSTTSLSSSLRAGERARALSSAAQDVYEFADERMKFLGAHFGTQLGALVGKVSQTQDLNDVRALMENTSGDDLEDQGRLSGKPLSSTVVTGTSTVTRNLRPASPAKSAASISQAQSMRAGGSFGRLSGLGMIRNLSNSFAGSQKTGPRESNTVSDLAR